MKKFLILIAAAVTISGCVEVEDNGPNRGEREMAWEWCTANDTHRAKEIDPEIRIACTQAIYGR
jgi:hypothetical protein